MHVNPSFKQHLRQRSDISRRIMLCKNKNKPEWWLILMRAIDLFAKLLHLSFVQESHFKDVSRMKKDVRLKEITKVCKVFLSLMLYSLR